MSSIPPIIHHRTGISKCLQSEVDRAEGSHPAEEVWRIHRVGYLQKSVERFAGVDMDGRAGIRYTRRGIDRGDMAPLRRAYRQLQTQNLESIVPCITIYSWSYSGSLGLQARFRDPTGRPSRDPISSTNAASPHGRPVSIRMTLAVVEYFSIIFATAT